MNVDFGGASSTGCSLNCHRSRPVVSRTLPPTAPAAQQTTAPTAHGAPARGRRRREDRQSREDAEAVYGAAERWVWSRLSRRCRCLERWASEANNSSDRSQCSHFPLFFALRHSAPPSAFPASANMGAMPPPAHLLPFERELLQDQQQGFTLGIHALGGILKFSNTFAPLLQLFHASPPAWSKGVVSVAATAPYV